MNPSYITEEEIRNLGAELDETALGDLLSTLNDKIDELVGEEVVESLTPSDIEELASIQDTASEEELASWVAERVPDYPEIIANNKDIVLGEYVDTLS